MSEQAVVQVDTPPAPVDASSLPATAPEQTNPLDSKVAELEATLKSQSDLLEQYKQALGTVVQQRSAPTQSATPARSTDDIESKFDPDAVRLVNTVAQNLIDKTVGKLTIRAEAQNKLGTDSELVKEGEKVFGEYKSNPYYSGQSDEILMALAASEASNRVNSRRLQAERESNRRLLEEQARRNQPQSGGLPPTAGTGFTAAANDNPDADLNQYMNAPANQSGFITMLGTVFTSDGRKVTNPFSEDVIRFHGEAVKVKDLFRRIAVRSTRTGIGLMERPTALPSVEGGNR